MKKKKNKKYDCIILMNVNKKNQYDRVMKRENMTPQLLKRILSNQTANKKKKADYVINNNGSKRKTRKNLQITLNKIISTTL